MVDQLFEDSRHQVLAMVRQIQYLVEESNWKKSFFFESFWCEFYLHH
jgi:hypothetical protein